VALLAVGPAADPVFRTALPTEHEVAVGLVGDDAAMTRVEQHRVADVRAFDEPVVVKEDATTVEAVGGRDGDIADEPVAREVDEVFKADRDAELWVGHGDLADERVFLIGKLALPRRVFEPGEPAVDEESGPAFVAHRLV